MNFDVGYNEGDPDGAIVAICISILRVHSSLNLFRNVPNILVLAFSVVGHETCARCRDEQVVKPVFMVDKAIELVCRRDGPFSDLGSWTVGHEVVKEHPSPDMQLSRAPVAMEVT